MIIAVSQTGNSLIGIVIYKKTTMRGKINYFILNMALSDILPLAEPKRQVYRAQQAEEK